jgi:parallel beta-helix repeat protein
LYSTSKGLKLCAAVGFLLLYSISALSAVLPVAAITPNVVTCGTTITTSTELKADIGPCSGNGIVIGSSGITLNCAGHTISGTSGSVAGISLLGVTTVTVKNCHVTGFASGIYLGASSSNKLTGNTANGNYGYYDDSVGSGTAGTANTYPLDECISNGNAGSDPTGLCTPQP